MSELKIQETSQKSTDAHGWSIDTEIGILKDSSGGERRLEPRLAKLMSLLLAQSGRYVSRNELIAKMWPNVVVTEQSLTRAVADLRKALNTSYEQPPIIDTASKQGYRLSIVAKAVNLSKGSVASRLGRYAAYAAVAFVLLILVLRGLSY